MRSSLSRTARQLPRGIARANPQICRVSGARWSSTEDGLPLSPQSPRKRKPGRPRKERAPKEISDAKWSTPLAKKLAEAITVTGPINVASYMRQCNTSDLGGYYTAAATPERDQFGAKGDFVTSPEISQIFGELIGVWVVAEWIAQGKKSEGVYLMEVGPGRGTLMDDMLRAIRNFPPLFQAIEAVYMVEASETLRKTQHKLLCGDNPLEKNEIGYESISKHSKNMKVIWTEDIRFIPREADKTPFIIAHEFFDALPVHIFQAIPPAKDEEGTINTISGPVQVPKQGWPKNHWRELLVSAKAPHKLKEGEPDFELSVAKKHTGHSLYLPDTSGRYIDMREEEGATIEISPESIAIARDFAIRIGGSNVRVERPGDHPNRPAKQKMREETFAKPEPSGAALVIDYGPPDAIPANSLRGIKNHQMVSPLSQAGTVDLSCDVDFLALAESAITSSPRVEVHGPVDQARFLSAMGIEERATQLIKKGMEKERSGQMTDKSELTEIVKRIESGWKRLVDTNPQGMGRSYQVMAIIPFKPPSRPGSRRPVGFGGDVTLGYELHPAFQHDS